MVVEGTCTGEGGILAGHLHEICGGGGESEDGKEALPHNGIRVESQQQGQGRTEGGVGEGLDDSTLAVDGGWSIRRENVHATGTGEGVDDLKPAADGG